MCTVRRDANKSRQTLLLNLLSLQALHAKFNYWWCTGCSCGVFDVFSQVWIDVVEGQTERARMMVYLLCLELIVTIYG